MVFSNRDGCDVDVFGMAERNNKSVPWVQGPFCASITRNAGSMESSAVPEYRPAWRERRPG